MASALKEPVKPGVEESAPVHRIRITLSSRNVKNLEKGTLLTRPLLHLVTAGNIVFAPTLDAC